MKPLLFVIILSFLAVSLVTAQKSATAAPKHYKAAAAEVPDSSVSPDGRFRLRMVATEGDDTHLFVRDLTTGESRPLMEGPGSVVAARLSPDGRLVAYIWGNALESEDPQIELRRDFGAVRVAYLRPAHSPEQNRIGTLGGGEGGVGERVAGRLVMDGAARMFGERKAVSGAVRDPFQQR